MDVLNVLAQAQPAPSATQQLLGMLVPMAAIMGIFYFLMIRPQRKKQKEYEAMLAALQSGDRVVTHGGIIGTVTRAEPDQLRLRIAPSVEIQVLRTGVAGKLGDKMLEEKP